MSKRVSVVLEKLAKFFRGYFFGMPGISDGSVMHTGQTDRQTDRQND